MKEYQYIEGRLEKQMNYYHKACDRLQKKYKACSIINIIITAVIPVVSLSDFCSNNRITNCIVAILGAACSVTTGIMLLGKYQENWIHYRETYEQLKSELALYKSGCGKYRLVDENEKMDKFIECCETIMGQEHKEWKIITKRKN